MRKCPLCHEKNSSTYMKAQAWNNRHGVELKKCAHCAFVFSAVEACDYTGTGGSYVVQSKDELKSRARKEKLDILAQEIVQKTGLTPNSKTLDFGCGVGLFSLCFQEMGFKTYGIEASTHYLEKHKELSLSSAADFEQLKQEKGTFDLVVVKDVLEHVNHPQELLQEIISYLKPGGYLYIRVPNVYHYRFHWSIDTKSHVNHFSPHKLMRLAEKNMLKKIDFIGVYDVSTKVGKIYHFIFWKLRNILPLYHQISLLYQKV